MMKLNEIGEFGLIEKIALSFKPYVSEGMMGIGDDCAVIPQRDYDLLVTTDMLIENIHFLSDQISPKELGHKSLAVNLSDIAAMGGTPICSFLSIALPSHLEANYVDEFMMGYKELSDMFSVALLGGDTTRSCRDIAINVTVMGRIQSEHSKLRSAAKYGQLICVTGLLGDAAGGLHAIMNSISNDPFATCLIKRHHNPTPKIREGIFLGNSPYVGAMMDISDGIASDLRHIMKASQVGAEVDINALPISDSLKSLSKVLKKSEFEIAACGGEDYELLFTVDADHFDDFNREYIAFFGTGIYPIGRITKNMNNITWRKDGIEITPSFKGFNHF